MSNSTEIRECECLVISGKQPKCVEKHLNISKNPISCLPILGFHSFNVFHGAAV